MLQQEDAADFICAIQTKIKAHEYRGYWEVVKWSFIPEGVKTIQAIRLFKRKQYPSGELDKHKYKARLCAHGGMQQWGMHYWETHAPVVNWISVCFLLILSEIDGPESQVIDFVLAFPQVDLDIPV